MLPKEKRLTREEFLMVLEYGSVLHGTHMSVRFFGQPDMKVACVVSKKVVSGAVGRHCFRRKGYALLKHILDKESLSKMHIVLFFKKGLDTVSPDVLSTELENIFDRIGTKHYTKE